MIIFCGAVLAGPEINPQHATAAAIVRLNMSPYLYLDD
jgi:hypothetical protein